MEHLVKLAVEASVTIVTAESCTAGALIATLAQAEGASAGVHGGLVCYSKGAKVAILGVAADLLAVHTAVAEPVVQAMAHGALARTAADICLAVTGVAGPEPDEDGNPVGLVFIAVATRDGRCEVCRLELGGGREEICDAAMRHVLELAGILLAQRQP